MTIGQYVRPSMKRDLEIIGRRTAGETLSSIGNEFGLSRESVRKIAQGRSGAEIIYASTPEDVFFETELKRNCDDDMTALQFLSKPRISRQGVWR